MHRVFVGPKRLAVSFQILSVTRRVVTCGLITLVCAGCAEAQTTHPSENYRPRRVIPPQPTITEFELKTVAQVGDDLNPTSLVLGVEIDGQARAYPINMLTGPRREIINDQLGNSLCAATW